eukprot:4762231-Pleurochrysis_carterae.AAC.1
MAAILHSLEQFEKEHTKLAKMVVMSREEIRALASELKTGQIESRMELTNFRSDFSQFRRAKEAPQLQTLFAHQQSESAKILAYAIAKQSQASETDDHAPSSSPGTGSTNWLLQAGKFFSTLAPQLSSQPPFTPEQLLEQSLSLKLNPDSINKSQEGHSGSGTAAPVAAAVPPAATAPKGGTRAAALAAQ